MKLSEYYKLINEIDGKPNPPDDPRITRKDFEFNGPPGQQGSATLTYLDGVPIYLNWYIWDLDLDWMQTQVEAYLGQKIILYNMNGGNGHESADLELVGAKGKRQYLIQFEKSNKPSYITEETYLRIKNVSYYKFKVLEELFNE